MKENIDPRKKLQFFKGLYLFSHQENTKIKYFKVNKLYKKVINQV